MIRVMLCVVQLMFVTIAAEAQTPRAAVRQFGLLGTWANDCSTEASSANEYAIFSITSDGTIQLRNDFGPHRDNMVYRILDAKPLGFYRLSLKQLLVTDSQILLDVVMLRTMSQIRIWSSRGSDGSTYVEDGLISSANGRETGWMIRCNGEWVEHLMSAPKIN